MDGIHSGDGSTPAGRPVSTTEQNQQVSRSSSTVPASQADASSTPRVLPAGMVPPTGKSDIHTQEMSSRPLLPPNGRWASDDAASTVTATGSGVPRHVQNMQKHLSPEHLRWIQALGTQPSSTDTTEVDGNRPVNQPQNS
jgi:hypothetical protein